MTTQTLDQVRAALSIAALNLEQAYYPDSAQTCREASAALDAEKGTEPVAWELRVDGRWKGCLRHKGLVDQITKGRDVEITPLYASPPQAAPSVANCRCTDWKPQTDYLNGIIFTQSARSGNPNWYQGMSFRFCPWCGGRSSSPPK